MVFGLMGLFRSALSTEKRSVRYLSDAVFWMYQMHLTLVVVAMLAWLRGSNAPEEIKFLLIMVTVSAVLLLAYQAVVRHSPVGALLDGKRRPLLNGSGAPRLHHGLGCQTKSHEAVRK